MKRIPSWPGVTNYSNKAEYQRADLVCYTSTSLATKRRTIHTQNVTLEAVHPGNAGLLPSPALSIQLTECNFWARLR
jgi:hypothetical protein